MANALGVGSKLAARIESDNGLINAVYPTTVALADDEEVHLDGYDLVPFLSEGIEEIHQYETDETLDGTPAVNNMDRVALEGGGPIQTQGYYDGLDALIACALGFENPEATASPDSINPTALAVVTGGAGQTASNWKDNGTPFTSADVGRFIRVTTGAGEGQVRRISAYVDSGEVTITPNWDTNPASTNVGEMDQEFEHLFEMTSRMDDMLFADLDDDNGFTYPTGGVGGATDLIIRRLTVGNLKWSTTPWIWRCCYVNGMSINFSSKSGLSISFDLIPFDLDRSSSTNGAASAADWAFSESPLFTPSQNERILFNHLGGSGFLRIDAFANGAMTSADEYGISAFTINLNNALKADDQDSNSTPYRVQPNRGGFREVTGSFTLPRYGADTFFTWADAATILQSHIKFVGSTIASTARLFEIFLGSFKITKPSAPISGPNVVPQTFEFRSLVPVSAPTFIASGNPTQIMTSPRSELMIRTTNQNPFNMFRDQNKEY